jgi:hypothetical protein
MKTRTLLLLALACGLAILLAGGALLFRLAGQDDPEPPTALGVATPIADMRVTVLGAAEASDAAGAGRLVVDVVIGGVDDPDGADGFELIAAGRPLQPSGAGTCRATGVEPQPCTLVFDVSAAAGESRVLRYHRGDDQARWDLRAGNAGEDLDGTVNGHE